MWNVKEFKVLSSASFQINRFRNAYNQLPNVAAMNSQYLEEKEEELTMKDKSFDVKTDLLTREAQRQRRSIETSDKKLWPKSAQISRKDESEFLSELNCGLTQCSFISCTIGPLAKKEYTLFKVKSRLWVRTLNEIQRKDIEISSKLVSRVTKLPYGVNPSYLGYQTHVVTTQVGIFAHTGGAWDIKLTNTFSGACSWLARVWQYPTVDSDPRHSGWIFISLSPHVYSLQARLLSAQKTRRLQLSGIYSGMSSEPLSSNCLYELSNSADRN